ncbi:gamma-soluble NSF attachment protein isoform X2 [Arachis duranensis]|uniref:Gamma-soluble NSF attachment protein n=1 Tax=Arachis duranensis TaxID=130453 RepID=A0A9C6WBD9_ARADU|nr:gamma-soluble NSF attachment protein isoform X2 [Arachis duranensis]
MPEEAIQLYTDAITILEEDGGGQMAFDLYRSATAVYIKLEKYLDAAPLQLKFGLAASKCNATNSQCKAYLSAIIIYLYTNDYKQAEMCYNDCSQIDAFCKSDQNRCASNLLAAYSDGDIEEIKRIAQSSSISNLDHSRAGDSEFRKEKKCCFDFEQTRKRDMARSPISGGEIRRDTGRSRVAMTAHSEEQRTINGSRQGLENERPQMEKNKERVTVVEGGKNPSRGKCLLFKTLIKNEKEESVKNINREVNVKL